MDYSTVKSQPWTWLDINQSNTTNQGTPIVATGMYNISFMVAKLNVQYTILVVYNIPNYWKGKLGKYPIFLHLWTRHLLYEEKTSNIFSSLCTNKYYHKNNYHNQRIYRRSHNRHFYILVNMLTTHNIMYQFCSCNLSETAFYHIVVWNKNSIYWGLCNNLLIIHFKIY